MIQIEFCHCHIFHRARLKVTEDINHNLITDNITLSKVSSIKYYGVIVDHNLIGFASKCHLNFLFLLQKKIIRIMTFSSYLAHTDPIFKNLTILPFNKNCIDRIVITVFKVEYELLPKSVFQVFSKNRDIHSHDTRDKY